MIKYILLLLMGSAVVGFMWIPIVAGAYALGRRQISLKFLFVVLAIESVALGFNAFLCNDAVFERVKEFFSEM